MTCPRCGDPMIADVPGITVRCVFNSHTLRLLPTPPPPSHRGPQVRITCSIGVCTRSVLPGTIRCRSHTTRGRRNRGAGKRKGGLAARRNRETAIVVGRHVTYLKPR